MIELAPQEEIAALKAQWTKLERMANDANLARDAGGKFKAGVTPPKWKGFERVDAEYRASEEKRKILRPPRVTRQEREENERWDKIYEERIEDKSYYAR